MAHKFLVHEPEDMVGVAVEDIQSGAETEGLVMSNNASLTVATLNPIPLGHKLALQDIRQGQPVIKYGVVIGEASTDIKKGQHVHVHNLRSIRWRNSVVAEAAARPN